MTKKSFPPVEELERNEDGYCIPPEGLSSISKIGAGYAKGHRGMVYPPGTFAENVTAFNTETALEARQIAAEKKVQAVRESIEALKGKPFEEAYGETAGIFWQEIVENPEATPRSRLDTWQAIGEEGGIRAAKGTTPNSGASIHVDGITPELAHELRELVGLLRQGRIAPLDSGTIDWNE